MITRRVWPDRVSDGYRAACAIAYGSGVRVTRWKLTPEEIEDLRKVTCQTRLLLGIPVVARVP